MVVNSQINPSTEHPVQSLSLEKSKDKKPSLTDYLDAAFLLLADAATIGIQSGQQHSKELAAGQGAMVKLMHENSLFSYAHVPDQVVTHQTHKSVVHTTGGGTLQRVHIGDDGTGSKSNVMHTFRSTTVQNSGAIAEAQAQNLQITTDKSNIAGKIAVNLQVQKTKDGQVNQAVDTVSNKVSAMSFFLSNLLNLSSDMIQHPIGNN